MKQTGVLWQGSFYLGIPSNCPTAWKRLIPYLSIAVIFVGSCGPVSWSGYGKHDNITKFYCIRLYTLKHHALNIYICLQVELNKPWKHYSFLVHLSHWIESYRRPKKKILIKFIPWIKKEKINQTYFAWGGVTMQEDVSILSLWTTNRPYMEIKRKIWKNDSWPFHVYIK